MGSDAANSSGELCLRVPSPSRQPQRIPVHHQPRASRVCIASSQHGSAPKDRPADAVVPQDEGQGWPPAIPAQAARAQRRAMLTLQQCRGPEMGCDLQGRIPMLKAAVKSPGRWDILLRLALSTSRARRFSLSPAIDLLSLKETRKKEQTKRDPPSFSPGEQIWL